MGPAAWGVGSTLQGSPSLRGSDVVPKASKGGLSNLSSHSTDGHTEVQGCGSRRGELSPDLESSIASPGTPVCIFPEGSEDPWSMSCGTVTRRANYYLDVPHGT